VSTSNLFAVDPIYDDRWQALVNEHPASSIFHTTGWLRALQSAYGYEPVVYTTCGPGHAIASGTVFCKISSWLTGRRLVSLPFSDHCDPLVEGPTELTDVLLGIRKKMNGKAYCELRPLQTVPAISDIFGESDQYFWHAIDLRPSLDVIFRKLHNSVQRNIRRAEREALTYEEGNSEQLLKQFYKLVVETRRRQHLPPQPIKWFRSLIANLGSNLQIRIASKDGVPIASILTLTHKKIITYKYGCSDAKMHKLGGMTLLFWNTIQQAKSADYETMDLGRSDTNNHGLAAFKEHLGGVRSNLVYWRYPNRPRVHQSSMRKVVVERIIDSAPDGVLTAAGNLLYRHMG
jgi:hypothetical protein